MRFEKIKILAKNRGITIKDLAEKIEMSEANLYKVFKRQSIETRYLEKIAEILDVPVSSFFSDIVSEDGKKIIQAGNNNHVGIGNGNSNSNASKELEACRKEVEYLKQRLKDKEELLTTKEEIIKYLKKED